MIDTHKMVKSLIAAGFDEAQAEAIVTVRNGEAVTQEYLDEKLQHLASKIDLYKMVLTIVLVIVTLTVSLTVGLIKLLP